MYTPNDLSQTGPEERDKRRLSETGLSSLCDPLVEAAHEASEVPASGSGSSSPAASSVPKTLNSPPGSDENSHRRQSVDSTLPSCDPCAQPFGDSSQHLSQDMFTSRDSRPPSCDPFDFEDNNDSVVVQSKDMTALIWQRCASKKGFGKRLPSKKSGWARRRIFLHGTKLLFLKDKAPGTGDTNDSDSDSSEEEGVEQVAATRKPRLYQTARDNLKNAKEYAKDNLKSAKDFAYSSSKSSLVRGSLDFARDEVFVDSCPAFAGAPTAFMSALKFEGKTLWTICYDDDEQQKEWFRALNHLAGGNSSTPRIQLGQGNECDWKDNVSVNRMVNSRALEEDKRQGVRQAPVAPSLLSTDSTDHEQKSSVPPNSLQEKLLEPEQLHLTAIVWKRRSRLGKLPPIKTWERRRLTLLGRKLMYFKSTTEVNGIDHDDSSDSESEEAEDLSGREDTVSAETVLDSVVSNQEIRPPVVGDVTAKLKHAKKGLYQSAKQNIKSAAKSAAAGYNSYPVPFSIKQEEPNAPRGVLDLVEDRASVAASPAHSGAPTPFAINIKVTQSETKWKFCFDTQAQQMEWLSALTDVLVSHSVEAYNADQGGNSGELKFDVKKSRHVSWEEFTRSTEDKGISYKNDVGSLNCRSANGTEYIATTDEIVETKAKSPGFTSSSSLMLGDKYWILPRNNFIIMVMFSNGALVYSQSVSLSSVDLCLLMMFVSIGMGLCLLNQPEGSLSFAVDSSEGSTESRSIPYDSEPNLSNQTRATTKVKSENFKADSKALTKRTRQQLAFLPVAGSTTVRIQNPMDPAVNSENQTFAGWRAMGGPMFQVRSHGYAASKEKVCSPGELYRLAAVDIFESKERIPDMSSRVKLPELEYDSDDVAKTWKSPDVFVVSLALPVEVPRIGRPTIDGQGYTVTMYFTMREETRETLRRITSATYNAAEDESEFNLDVQKRMLNGVRLWEQWCKTAPNDERFQGRFKVLVNAHNLAEIGVPSWIAKYNGKPFLIKRSGVTGFLYDHPELNVMEFGISFHQFPYLFKQATAYLKEHYFKKVLVTFGFCIEGRNDDELPEVVIGEGLQLCYPDPAIAIQAEDLFNGCSPKSAT